MLNLVQEVADRNNVVTDEVYLNDDETEYYRDIMYPNQDEDDE